jgi:hypothetical protein
VTAAWGGTRDRGWVARRLAARSVLCDDLTCWRCISAIRRRVRRWDAAWENGGAAMPRTSPGRPTPPPGRSRRRAGLSSWPGLPARGQRRAWVGFVGQLWLPPMCA